MLLLSRKTILPWTIALVLVAMLQQVDSSDQQIITEPTPLHGNSTKCYHYVGMADAADRKLRSINCTLDQHDTRVFCTYRTTLTAPFQLRLGCEYYQNNTCEVVNFDNQQWKSCQCYSDRCNEAVPQDCTCATGPGPRCFKCTSDCHNNKELPLEQCNFNEVCQIKVNVDSPEDKTYGCAFKDRNFKICEVKTEKDKRTKVCHCESDKCNEFEPPEGCDCDKDLKPKPTAKPKPKPTGNSAGSRGLHGILPATVVVLVGAYQWTFF